MGTIEARLEAVRRRIAAAAAACGRDPDTVSLVAVSKTKPASAVREAHAAGQLDFGENYVQEMVRKAEELSDLRDLRWHMIGHLQRNKVKAVVRVAAAVHTVDSIRLVAELGKRAAAREAGRPLPVLIEVNLGGERQKGGCAPAEAAEIADAVEACPSLRLAGLMTVPPHTDDPEGARPFFDRLVDLRDELGGVARLAELSMGMTHDLEQAIEAGATVVRVGTALFGARSARVPS